MIYYLTNYNFNSKKKMIADYLVNRIDNLFTDKQLKHNRNQPYKPVKSEFNKNVIKNHLPDVICRNPDVSRSPVCFKDKSPSPLAKSRLKSVL